ncbi:MAG: beta-ketoacyl synthase N-terminal-like domain-containing protein [Myxococcota bacterium]
MRAGLGSCVLAGASDSLCRLTFTGFNALGSLDPNPCRPFDEARNGLGLGEGAAFVVLESDTAARERGATPIAELAGWAAGAEAHHITNPEASGSVAARVMREALTRAELGAEDVDYVNAHGTATPLNDPMEVRAVRTALGSAFDAAVISSIKGQIGHSLGAAGAVETAVTALCVSDGRVPPTGGLASPAEDCQANHVIGAARELTIRAALSNSFGFGGLDGVIAVTRPEYPPEQEARTQRRIHVGGGAVTTPEGVQSLRALPLRPPQSPPRGPLPPEVTGSFDPRRGRRLGKGERLLAAVIDAAGAVSSDVVPGLVVSKPSGNPDATSRFMDRIRKRGPRFASPADFPNLMLSSLAGHASIYHRLQGPALTTSARRGGGLCSLRTAWELLVAGMDAPLFTGAADPWGMAADSDDLPRAECAAAVLLSAHDTEAASSGASFAALQLVEDLETLPPPSGDARLLTCDGADPAVLEPSPWATVPLHAAEDWFGASHAVTVAAVNTAAAWVARGACDQVLVLAMEEGPVIAILVERP